MEWQGCNVKMNKWECFQVLLYAMTRVQWWISEDVFKFFFMQWQGCNVKMNKWGCFQGILRCFQVLLYAMTRMQC